MTNYLYRVEITEYPSGVREKGGGYPTKSKDMPIRDGFPHQFTPAVPKGMVPVMRMTRIMLTLTPYRQMHSIRKCGRELRTYMES